MRKNDEKSKGMRVVASVERMDSKTYAIATGRREGKTNGFKTMFAGILRGGTRRPRNVIVTCRFFFGHRHNYNATVRLHVRCGLRTLAPEEVMLTSRLLYWPRVVAHGPTGTVVS